MSFCEREGDFSIGKDVHGYINEGFSLINISDDFFLEVIVKGEVDFGFGKGGNRYSYG
ncbi:unnamed protein product, partial [marine sediment metagenome]